MKYLEADCEVYFPADWIGADVWDWLVMGEYSTTPHSIFIGPDTRWAIRFYDC